MSVLSVIVFLPLAAAWCCWRCRGSGAAANWIWVAVTAADVALTAVVWALYRTPRPGALAFEEKARWIPGVNSSYHLGVDGLSLPLVVMTAVIFLACALYSLRGRDRPKPLAALFCSCRR